ncbi:hypothetical protein C8J36_11079 [Rhizobium sp. PP-F2F-G48]|uniref:hypothetical protein n=1 Tax=Rhizobium sp. PP-F2F-G48 TaxID=2135651 RepID=UPI0010DFB35E|nr:hypothetical protein [Rhizobium sp. PP-F2F-G48]TCM51072.1 hypothetical protein C8J36_11079 [Rhizobium sp. PP-F2F-G48]
MMRHHPHPGPFDPGALARMEEARRQTRRQLDLIERQIVRAMTAAMPALRDRRRRSCRDRSPDPAGFMQRYREILAAITAERQPEIDALSRKLARQDQAIEHWRSRLLSAQHAA